MFSRLNEPGKQKKGKEKNQTWESKSYKTILIQYNLGAFNIKWSSQSTLCFFSARSPPSLLSFPFSSSVFPLIFEQSHPCFRPLRPPSFQPGHLSQWLTTPRWAPGPQELRPSLTSPRAKRLSLNGLHVPFYFYMNDFRWKPMSWGRKRRQKR